MALFTVWVLTPFAALSSAQAAAMRWPSRSRLAIHGVTLAVTLLSLVIYGNVVFGPPRPQPAAWFVVLPPASCVAIAIVVAAAKLSSRRT
jgi:hypothetical protein